MPDMSYKPEDELSPEKSNALESLKRIVKERKQALDDEKRRKEREEAEAQEANRRAKFSNLERFLNSEGTYRFMIPFLDTETDTIPGYINGFVFKFPGTKAAVYLGVEKWTGFGHKWFTLNSANKWVSHTRLSDALIAARVG